VGPGKKILTQAEITRLKGGDYFRLVVGAFSYKQQGGGVSLGLNVVQFIKAGDPLSIGGSGGVHLLPDIEVTEEDAANSDGLDLPF